MKNDSISLGITLQNYLCYTTHKIKELEETPISFISYELSYKDNPISSFYSSNIEEIIKCEIYRKILIKDSFWIKHQPSQNTVEFIK